MVALISTAPAPAQGELDDAVKKAAAAREDYIRRFRDLTATETWITEVLRPDGTVRQRRTVHSDLFVYQSRVDSRVTREHRIAREVDGRDQGDPLARATKQFRELGVVPIRIAIDKFDKVREKKSAPSLRLSLRQSFDYSAFRRFDVSTATDIEKPKRNELDDLPDTERHR